jgi:hypothetical protein
MINEKTMSLTNGFSFKNNPNTSFKSVVNFFDDQVKTGYGCLKKLEEILKNSNKSVIDPETGKEIFYQLIFYNFALGNSYLVELKHFTANQDQQSNMIWNYNLQLIAIAPIEALYSKAKLKDIQENLVAGAVVSTMGNIALNNARKALNFIR